MAENKKFCIFCGVENEIDAKKCFKCKKKLDVKDTPLRDYLKSKIKDKYIGKVKDSFFSIITNYIKSHLYGFILTCSVLVTTTSIAVNIVTNSTNQSFIQEVQEKPTVVFQTNYLGEGLSALEVAEKYVKALDESDIKTVKGLQLESFYPNIREELKDKKYLDFCSLIMEHNLVDNVTTYFKHNNSDIYIGPSELVIASGNYGNYKFERLLVSTSYCSNNVCKMDDMGRNINIFYAHNDIELIEVEGNYYVSGEKVSMFMGQDEEINLKALFRVKGDTTNLDFNLEQRKYNECHDDKECLSELGF